MKVHQLSLFLENRPGTLKIPVQSLAEAGINLAALCLADTSDFGILRLIVQDWPRARSVLEKAGCVVSVTEVLALDVADTPGGLGAILEILEEAKLEIEYMYAFSGGAPGAKAALIFRFQDPDGAIRALERNGINIIAPVQLFKGRAD